MISTAAYLDITSFVGLSAGAKHSYGKIIFNDKSYELQRKITQEEASIFNKNDKCDCYKKGQMTIRFGTDKDVIGFAKKFFKKELIKLGAKYLIKGDNAIAEPQQIIIGSGKEIKRINSLSRKAEKIGHWDNEEKMNKIWEEWRILSNKLGINKLQKRG